VVIKELSSLPFMSTYVVLTNDAPKHAKTGQPGWIPSRAASEPLVMLEMLVAKYLESNADMMGKLFTNGNKNSSTQPKVHPLSMISYLQRPTKVRRENLSLRPLYLESALR
jgi:hypothetical protein